MDVKLFSFLMLVLVLFNGCVAEECPCNETENETLENETQENETEENQTILDINSFDECAAAGYPIMESYPRQCRTPGGRTFISLDDLFDSNLNTSCSNNSDCMLVNKELAFACCWEGACGAINYSENKWIGVNKEWFERTREEYCPEDCGPAPGCAVKSVNENFTTKCIRKQCVKMPLPEANLTVPDENETKEGLYFGNGSYVLVLDDAVLPAYEGTCGLFSIKYASNYSTITQFIECPAGSETWISPDGHEYRIMVVEVAAGYTKEALWAEVIIFG